MLLTITSRKKRTPFFFIQLSSPKCNLTTVIEWLLNEKVLKERRNKRWKEEGKKEGERKGRRPGLK